MNKYFARSGLVDGFLTTLLSCALCSACGSDQAMQPVQVINERLLVDGPVSPQLAESPITADEASTQGDNPEGASEHEAPPSDVSHAGLLGRSGEVSAYDELGALGPRPQEAHGLSDAELRNLLGDSAPAEDALCQGPWLSRTFDCYRMGTSPACGVLTEQVDEEVVEYEGCSRPEFGLMGMLQDHETPITQALQTIHSGNVCKKGGQSLDQGEPLAHATAQCSEHHTRAIQAQPGRSDWTASCAQVRRMAEAHRPLGRSCHFGGKKSYVLWSADVRFMRPLYVYRAQDPACGRKAPVVMRRLQDRSFRTCRLPQFGREDSNVCGAPEVLWLSQSGMRRSQLNAETQVGRSQGAAPARCMTCDDLPMGSGAQVGNKWHCIRKSVTEAAQLLQEAEAINTPARARLHALHEGLLLRGRALFESVFAPMPTAADAVSLYRPCRAAAGTVGAAIARDDALWTSQLQLCEALLQHHVDPQRIETTYPDCLALTTDAWGEAGGRGVPDAEQRRQATRLSMRLYGHYVRSVRSSGHQVHPSDLQQAAGGMARAWFVHARSNAVLSHVPRGELARVRDLMQSYAGAEHEAWTEPPAGR